MKFGTLAFLLIVIIALNSSASASYWSLRVDTNNSTHWAIYRQSSNISFDLTGFVNGTVSPVDISPVKSRSRILSPYQSNYAEVGNNDVRFRQRTSSLQGSYKSEDEIMMQSVVPQDEIVITVDKMTGSDLMTIEYEGEKRPVFIKSNRTLSYSGKGINDRDFEGNNGDFVGASFLYNRELSKEQKTVMWLKSLNATVLAIHRINATDLPDVDTIFFAELEPTKYLGYEIKANSTGIADLSYRFRDTVYDVKNQNYPALSIGEERYFGKYNIVRNINMKSVFEKLNSTEEEMESWLPCCYAGWKDMMPFDRDGFAADTKGVFDCTCYKKIESG